MFQKAITLFLILSSHLISSSQIVEKASLMTINDPYGQADRPHLYKPLKNGNKILIGRIGNTMHYNNWNITNTDSLPQNLRYYFALFSKNDSLLWVKYTNGYIQSVETDSKNNIYLTGSYKSLLHTSDGDTLALLSNNTNYYGNVFILKLDSAGHKKWWKTSDNEAFGQAEPYGDYIKIDSDYNVYISGHYDYFIKFSSQISFTRASPFIGYIPFLAKLDSNGNYKWVRDWNFDSGLPCGLSIDSCGIYMYTVRGASQTNLRIRKYDFTGRLIDMKSIACNTGELFWANNINVKNDRLLMISLEGNQKKIGYYDLSGNILWSKNYSANVSVDNLEFTQQNKIFFSGSTYGSLSISGVEGTIGTTIVPRDIYWGFMDTMGNILSIKSIPNVVHASLPSLPFLAEDSRLYVNAAISYYSNSNSNTFTLDTITFNNLTYYDSSSGIISGIYYRLLAQYYLGDGAYFNPGNCNFSPSLDTCLDREGLLNCPPPGAFTLSIVPGCNGTRSQTSLNWTTSPYAIAYSVYRDLILYSSGNTGTQFIDTGVIAGNSYSYSIRALNSVGSTNNSNGALSATAPNCSVTAVIEPANNPFEIRIFPNPSNGEYYLTAKKMRNKVVSIDIINFLGQVIYSNEQKSISNDFSKTINITKAASGLYLVKLTIDKKTYLLTVAKH